MFDAVTEVTKKARNRHNYASNRLNLVNYRQSRGPADSNSAASSTGSVAASTAAAMRPRSFQSVRSCPMAMWWTSTPQVHAVLFVSPNEYKDDPARTVASLAERFCAYFSTELANIKGELTALANSRDAEAARHHTGFLQYFTSFSNELTMPSDETTSKTQVLRPTTTTEPIQLSSDYFPDSGSASGSESRSASGRVRPGSSTASSSGGQTGGTVAQTPHTHTDIPPGQLSAAVPASTTSSTAASPWASASQHSDSRSRQGLPSSHPERFFRAGFYQYQPTGADDAADSVSFELSTSGDQAYDWGVHSTSGPTGFSSLETIHPSRTSPELVSPIYHQGYPQGSVEMTIQEHPSEQTEYSSSQSTPGAPGRSHTSVNQ